MKSTTVLAATLFLLPVNRAIAQSSPRALDADGNYVPSYSRGVVGKPGPDAPGDLLRTFAVSNATALSGYAAHNSAGFWANLSGGNAEVFEYTLNGALIQTLAVTDVNDSWPGVDSSRKTLICVNAFDDTMSGYDCDTGAPLFRFPTPTAGPVGATYDSTRDIYWYCDWTTNELIGLDASAAQSGVATIRDQFSTAGQITRIAGAAYNCLDDTIVSGGRDQGMQVAYDTTSKAVVASWIVLGGSVNDPQGCGMSAESGIYTTDFQDLNTRTHEGTVGIRPGISANGSVVTIVNFANSETRALVGHAGSAGRSIIKGVLTCLDRSSGVVNGGRVTLTGSPPTGSTNIGATGRAIQAGLLPSKLLTNLTFN